MGDQPSSADDTDFTDKHIAFIKVDKGRITVPSTRATRSFMWNPTSVKITHGWKWAKQAIFGNSHNMMQGGSGEDEVVSFSLIIDGDRGRSEARRATGTSSTANAATSRDISDELNWYRSLTYPLQASPTVQGGYITGSTPPVVVLTLGTMFTKAACVVENVDITVSMFTPLLEPMHATIEMKLAIYAARPVYLTDIYASSDPEGSTDLSSILSMAGPL